MCIIEGLFFPIDFRNAEAVGHIFASIMFHICAIVEYHLGSLYFFGTLSLHVS